MKVAIATEGTNVAQHFGRCDGYTIYEVNNGEVASKSFETAPPHQPGMMPKWLNGHGANVVIAGGAGAMAQQLFGELGIKLMLGVSGSLEDTIKSYLESDLKAGESMCDH